MKPKYQLAGSEYEVELVRQRDALTLAVDGVELDVEVERHDAHHLELLIDGRVRHVYAAQDGNRLFVHIDGCTRVLDVVSEFDDAVAGAGADGGLTIAPMPGVVLERFVQEGDIVAVDQPLLLIESMKIQTELKATLAGSVNTVAVDVGQSFDKGAVLIEIAAEDAAE